LIESEYEQNIIHLTRYFFANTKFMAYISKKRIIVPVWQGGAMAHPFEELVGMSRSKLCTSNNVVLYGWQVKNIVHMSYLKYVEIATESTNSEMVCHVAPVLMMRTHSTKSIIIH
ncbi:hypothetical protein ACJX0J_028147, partial [Zea mays]